MIIQHRGSPHLRVQGSTLENHIFWIAYRLPKLSFAGLWVVGFVESDQNDGATKEDIVACRGAPMLETALVNSLFELKSGR
jgi:hypothetical protein